MCLSIRLKSEKSSAVFLSLHALQILLKLMGPLHPTLCQGWAVNFT